MRSIFSERYNKKEQRANMELEDVFRNVSWLPKISRISKIGEDTVKTSDNLQKKVKNCDDLKAPSLLTSSDWYDSDKIPITTRWALEKVLNFQLLKHHKPDNGSGAFSHIVWTSSESDFEEESLKKPFIKRNRLENNRLEKNSEIKTTNNTIANLVDKSEHENSVKSYDDEFNNYLLALDFTKQKKHLSLESNGNKQVLNECTFCPKKFMRPSMLSAHMRTHTGERPFVCPTSSCKKTFADRSNLRAHQRAKKHHNWSFYCLQCGKPFNQETYLKRHSLEACRKYLLGRPVNYKKETEI